MALLRDFRLYTPETLSEARDILAAQEKPLVLAGGTLVLNYLKKASAAESLGVIGLKRVPELKGVKETTGSVSVGALTTISQLLESRLIQENFPSLFCACRQLAATPVRNMATIGGNLASRFFWVDLPAVLISLGARVCLLCGEDEKILSIEEFLRDGPRAKFILKTVILPKTESAACAHYFRHTKTMKVDVLSLALAFCACRADNKLKGVKLVVNPALSFPFALKTTAKLFQDTGLESITTAEIEAALKNDLEKTKLGQAGFHLLSVDLGRLTKFLLTPGWA